MRAPWTPRDLSLAFFTLEGAEGDGHPPPPLVPLPVDRVAINKPLAYFPQEADLMSLTS